MSTNLGAATAICTVGEDHTFYRAVMAGDQTGATYTLALWSSGVYRSPIALTLDGSDGSNGLTVAYDSEADETTVVAALTETQTATTLGAGTWHFDLLQAEGGVERRGKTFALNVQNVRRHDKKTIEETWREDSTEAVTVLQGPPGPKGDKGDPGEGGGGGSGTVTSVAITGANGISVSGSPITTSGTIALSVDAATLRAHLDVLTSGQISTTLEDYVTATGLSTTLEDYALASSVPTEPGDIGAAAATHSHVIADVTGLQTALDGKAASSHIHSIANVTGLQTALNARLVAANNLSDLPSASTARTNLGLAAVAASGDYGDLSNAPALATVATTGSYDDLTDTPTLGTAAAEDATAFATAAQGTRADAEYARFSAIASGDTLAAADPITGCRLGVAGTIAALWIATDCTAGTLTLSNGGEAMGTVDLSTDVGAGGAVDISGWTDLAVTAASEITGVMGGTPDGTYVNGTIKVVQA